MLFFFFLLVLGVPFSIRCAFDGLALGFALRCPGRFSFRFVVPRVICFAAFFLWLMCLFVPFYLADVPVCTFFLLLMYLSVPFYRADVPVCTFFILLTCLSVPFSLADVPVCTFFSLADVPGCTFFLFACFCVYL